MKPIKRKLNLNTETIRTLTTHQLGQVVGGSNISSERSGMCSTVEETGCLESGNDFCQTSRCPSNVCATQNGC